MLVRGRVGVGVSAALGFERRWRISSPRDRGPLEPTLDHCGRRPTPHPGPQPRFRQSSASGAACRNPRQARSKNPQHLRSALAGQLDGRCRGKPYASTPRARPPRLPRSPDGGFVGGSDCRAMNPANEKSPQSGAPSGKPSGDFKPLASLVNRYRRQARTAVARRRHTHIRSRGPKSALISNPVIGTGSSRTFADAQPMTKDVIHADCVTGATSPPRAPRRLHFARRRLSTRTVPAALATK